jgi:hypothetical protein
MSPVIDELTVEVTNATGVDASATTLINGFAARLQAGIDAALANGATAEQLAPLHDLGTALQAGSDALAAAVAANPPPGP